MTPRLHDESQTVSLLSQSQNSSVGAIAEENILLAYAIASFIFHCALKKEDDKLRRRRLWQLEIFGKRNRQKSITGDSRL